MKVLARLLVSAVLIFSFFTIAGIDEQIRIEPITHDQPTPIVRPGEEDKPGSGGYEQLPLELLQKIENSQTPPTVRLTALNQYLALDVPQAKKAKAAQRYLDTLGEAITQTITKEEDPREIMDKLGTLTSLLGEGMPMAVKEQLSNSIRQLKTYQKIRNNLNSIFFGDDTSFNAAVELIAKNPNLANETYGKDKDPLLVYAMKMQAELGTSRDQAFIDAIKQAGVSPKTVQAVIAGGFDPSGLDRALLKYTSDVEGTQLGQLLPDDTAKALDALKKYATSYNLLHGTSFEEMLQTLEEDPQLANTTFLGKSLLEGAVKAGNLDLVRALIVSKVNPMLMTDWAGFIDRLPADTPNKEEIKELLRDYQLDYDTNIMQQKAASWKITQLFTKWWNLIRDFFTRTSGNTPRTYSLGQINFGGKMEPVEYTTTAKALMDIDQEAMAKVMIQKIVNEASQYNTLSSSKQTFIRKLADAGYFTDKVRIGATDLGVFLKEKTTQKPPSVIEHTGSATRPVSTQSEPIVLTMDKPGAAGAGAETRSRSSSMSSTGSFKTALSGESGESKTAGSLAFPQRELELLAKGSALETTPIPPSMWGEKFLNPVHQTLGGLKDILQRWAEVKRYPETAARLSKYRATLTSLESVVKGAQLKGEEKVSLNNMIQGLQEIAETIAGQLDSLKPKA